MLITIRYFANIREIVGQTVETRDVAEGATAGSVVDTLVTEYPRLAGIRRATLLMVNQDYVPADHRLSDGDEFVLIPPVSGGDIADEGRLFRVTTEILDPREVEAVVASPSTGAIVTFTGT